MVSLLCSKLVYKYNFSSVRIFPSFETGVKLESYADLRIVFVDVITFFKIAAFTFGKGTGSSSSSSIPKST